MRAQLILGYRRDIAPMEPHLGWSRNVPSLTSIRGVGGARFHVSRVMGRKLCGGREFLYTPKPGDDNRSNKSDGRDGKPK